jgi:hypothetical protein
LPWQAGKIENENWDQTGMALSGPQLLFAERVAVKWLW